MSLPPPPKDPQRPGTMGAFSPPEAPRAPPVATPQSPKSLLGLLSIVFSGSPLVLFLMLFMLTMLGLPGGELVPTFLIGTLPLVGIILGALGLEETRGYPWSRQRVLSAIGTALGSLVCAAYCILTIVLCRFNCTPTCTPAVAAMAFVRPTSLDPTSHHPPGPKYAADVYAWRGRRFCIGCHTAIPAFSLAWFLLILGAELGTFWPWLLSAGGALILPQTLSILGLARHRAAKITVKLALGIGLALFFDGLLEAPWPVAYRVGPAAAVLVALAIGATVRHHRLAPDWAAAEKATLLTPAT